MTRSEISIEINFFGCEELPLEPMGIGFLNLQLSSINTTVVLSDFLF